MCVVLFWRKGIMGDKEFDIERIANRFKPKKKKGEVSGNE